MAKLNVPERLVVVERVGIPAEARVTTAAVTPRPFPEVKTRPETVTLDVVIVKWAAVTDPALIGQPSRTLSIHVPLAVEREENAALILVGGCGPEANGPDAVER